MSSCCYLKFTRGKCERCCFPTDPNKTICRCGKLIFNMYTRCCKCYEFDEIERIRQDRNSGKTCYHSSTCVVHGFGKKPQTMLPCRRCNKTKVRKGDVNCCFCRAMYTIEGNLDKYANRK